MPKFSFLMTRARLLIAAPGCAQASGDAAPPSIFGAWAVTEIDGAVVHGDADAGLVLRESAS